MLPLLVTLDFRPWTLDFLRTELLYRLCRRPVLQRNHPGDCAGHGTERGHPARVATRSTGDDDHEMFRCANQRDTGFTGKEILRGEAHAEHSSGFPGGAWHASMGKHKGPNIVFANPILR